MSKGGRGEGGTLPLQFKISTPPELFKRIKYHSRKNFWVEGGNPHAGKIDPPPKGRSPHRMFDLTPGFFGGFSSIQGPYKCRRFELLPWVFIFFLEFSHIFSSFSHETCDFFFYIKMSTHLAYQIYTNTNKDWHCWVFSFGTFKLKLFVDPKSVELWESAIRQKFSLSLLVWLQK